MRKLIGALLAGVCFAAQAPRELAHDILEQLVNINTSDSVGNCTAAAEAMAARLRTAGFPEADIHVLGPDPRKHNLVVRYHGGNAGKPLLLLAHLDVVEARREDWSFDPFHFFEKDGYFYGRGTSDDKAQASAWIANLIRLKQENYKPDRDIVVALTADEEGGKFNGPDWLLKNHRELVDAAYCLNEGGRGQITKAGKRTLNGVQASEKVFLSFHMDVKNAGGHSSQPRKDNAIYQLADGLGRLARFNFPVRLNEVTEAYFERMAKIEGGTLGADMEAATHANPDPAALARLSANPFYNALMRTTCVATMLEGGHAENALPQSARATVNCRVLPSENLNDVQETLRKVVADPAIVVTPIEPPKPTPPSPLTPEIMQPIERVTKEMWPGVPVVPVMGTGATDSLYFRKAGIPSYGVSGFFHDPDDNRAHGKDERIGVSEFYDGQEFMYRLVKALTSK